MGMLARIGHAWVKWKSRYGLRDFAPVAGDDQKQESLRVGLWGKRMLTGIYGAAATFSSPRILSRRGKKANSTSWDLTARRWHLWKCEPTRSRKGGRVARIKHRQIEAPSAGAHRSRLSARTPCEKMSGAVRRHCHRQYARKAAGSAAA